jgi:hypothetical protein
MQTIFQTFLLNYDVHFRVLLFEKRSSDHTYENVFYSCFLITQIFDNVYKIAREIFYR